MIRTRVIGEHRGNCYALKHFLAGFWNTPWAYFKDVTWKDKRGGNTGRTEMWAIAGCNDTDCQAEVLVNMEDVWDAIHQKEPTL